MIIPYCALCETSSPVTNISEWKIYSSKKHKGRVNCHETCYKIEKLKISSLSDIRPVRKSVSKKPKEATNEVKGS